MDVKTTILNIDLDEEIYMEQPEGFSAPGKNKKVHKLVKSLYGLNKLLKTGMRSLTTLCCQIGLKSMSVTNVYMSKTLTKVMSFCVYTLMTYSLLVVMMRCSELPRNC